MRLLFTICARAGSKGVKDKNVREFCEKPLVYYTIRAYQGFCEKYDKEFETIRLALNTDSEVLVKQTEAYVQDFLRIERREEHRGDFVSKLSVIEDTWKQAMKQNECRYDVVVDLDLTSPLRQVKDIKGTLDALIKNEGADLAYSVTKARRSPYFNMVEKKENGYYGRMIQTEYVSRQQAPACYDMNASIYAYRDSYLEEQNREPKAVIWEMPDSGVLDIDSEEDFELLQVIARVWFERRGI